MKIKIAGEFYSFFDKVIINEKLDSVASLFSFDARFNPDNEQHKKIFRPLSYLPVEIYDDAGALRLTGTLVNTALGSNSQRDLQNLSGYSKAGVLEDCSIPVSSYPLERINVSLTDIATRLLAPFGISFIVEKSAERSMKEIYPKTTAEPTDSVKDFLSKLASQKNIVLGHTATGNLRFFKPDIHAKSKAFLTEQNTITMSLGINGQAMHSNISVIRQPSKENISLSAVDTITNPMVLAKRSIVKTLSSGTETDTKNAADNVLADELKNISIDVELRKYIDVRCGDIVDVHNHEIFLFNRTRLMVSELNVSQSKNEQSMSLKLVLPETFTGQTPKNIFV
jgi:prophage tail gpP-like protein